MVLNPNALSSLIKQTYKWMRNRKNIIASLLTANRICTYKGVDLFRADLHQIVVTHNRLSESLYCHDFFQKEKKINTHPERSTPAVPQIYCTTPSSRSPLAVEEVNYRKQK